MELIDPTILPFAQLPDADDEQLQSTLRHDMGMDPQQLTFQLFEIGLDEFKAPVPRTWDEFEQDHCDDEQYALDFGPDPKGSSRDRVNYLLERYRQGLPVNPLVLYRGDGQVWKADGYHRRIAAHLAGLTHLPAYVSVQTVPE